MALTTIQNKDKKYSMAIFYRILVPLMILILFIAGMYVLFSIEEVPPAFPSAPQANK